MKEEWFLVNPAVFYGVGWDASELTSQPQPLVTSLPSKWIHTGVTWVALPDPVYRVWRSARHQPVPYATIRAAIAGVFSDNAEAAWATWWRSRVWMAWPWGHDPYGASEADQLTLVTSGLSPDIAIEDVVWQAHPSLAQLLDRVSPRVDATEKIAMLCRDGQAHWLVGRRGLPEVRNHAVG